jgi:hypothetical protein
MAVLDCERGGALPGGPRPYTHRVAISNGRLIRFDKRYTTFRVKQSL